MDMAALSAAATHDFSMWALFLKADVVVKAVMIVLLLASVWCWAIIFDKVTFMGAPSAPCRRWRTCSRILFWSGGSLEDLYDRVGNRSRAIR